MEIGTIVRRMSSIALNLDASDGLWQVTEIKHTADGKMAHLQSASSERRVRYWPVDRLEIVSEPTPKPKMSMSSVSAIVQEVYEPVLTEQEKKVAADQEHLLKLLQEQKKTIVTVGGPQFNHRSELLHKAEEIITKDRNNSYGEPDQDFARIAELWSTYLGHSVKPHDVAAMMIMLKLSRISWNPTHEDSWLDAAGYAACGFETMKLRHAD